LKRSSKSMKMINWVDSATGIRKRRLSDIPLLNTGDETPLVHAKSMPGTSNSPQLIS
jgi:hypothetical protein